MFFLLLLLLLLLLRSILILGFVSGVFKIVVVKGTVIRFLEIFIFLRFFVFFGLNFFQIIAFIAGFYEFINNGFLKLFPILV